MRDLTVSIWTELVLSQNQKLRAGILKALGSVVTSKTVRHTWTGASSYQNSRTMFCFSLSLSLSLSPPHPLRFCLSLCVGLPVCSFVSVSVPLSPIIFALLAAQSVSLSLSLSLFRMCKLFLENAGVASKLKSNPK